MLSRLPLAVVCWVGLHAMAIAVPLSDWTTVVTLRSGASVRVESSDGMVQQGQFVGADTDHLAITVARRLVNIRRAEVRRLYRVSERKVGRFALRGLGIGATGGAAVGAVAAETDKAQWSALMALGWGAVGAVIGAINGLDRDRVLIYEAEIPNSNQPTTGCHEEMKKLEMAKGATGGRRSGDVLHDICWSSMRGEA